MSLVDVSFRYPGGRGVEDLRLRLERGQTLGLLGPNGSGKTTILHLVTGLRVPQQGRVQLCGAAPSPRTRRSLGVVFQDASLDPMMSVRETLWLHGRLFGMSGAVLQRRIETLLAEIGLADRGGDAIETLSGGLKRRVELARAILHAPEVLLLDEPSLGLDPDSKMHLWELLREINTRGTALLLATNDVAEAERYCQHVAMIEHGHVIAGGTPAELKRDLRHDSVQIDWPQQPPGIAERLAGISGVGRVTCAPPVVHVTVDSASSFIPELFRIADGAIRGIRIHESTLEDAYFQRVGKPLQPNPTVLVASEPAS